MLFFNFEQVLTLLYRLLFITFIAGFLYGFLFYGLRFIFRKFERELALVTLYVSAYPALSIFIITGLRFAIASYKMESEITWLNKCLDGGTIVTASYWSIQELKNPNLGARDREFLPTSWEYKIELLRRRAYWLLQKFMNLSRSETRLDDYIKKMAVRGQTQFKQLRSQYQEPQLGIDKTLEGGPDFRLSLHAVC